MAAELPRVVLGDSGTEPEGSRWHCPPADGRADADSLGEGTFNATREPIHGNGSKQPKILRYKKKQTRKRTTRSNENTHTDFRSA